MPRGRARPGCGQLGDFVGEAVERAQGCVERGGDRGGEKAALVPREARNVPMVSSASGVASITSWPAAP